MKILGTGLTGLVGSGIVEVLKDDFEFENMSRSSGVDISNFDQVFQTIQKSNAEVVLHIAAKADVDGCEVDREIDAAFLSGKVSKREIFEKQTAFAVNVLGTKNIAQACFETGKKLIYISTDFVFDGEQEVGSSYKENDISSPINWYGETKWRGEKEMKNSGCEFIIARISYPYRAHFDKKKDFVRAILSRLESGQEVTAVKDHFMCPTFIDDIAHALKTLIEKNESGIYHISGSSTVTPIDAVKSIARVFEIDNARIYETTRDEYFKQKAKRPFNVSLNNDRIKYLGVTMKTFEEGLLEMRRQRG